MTTLHVLRVFCDSEGQFGSPLGVFLDGPAIRPERRQPLAAELGFSETVYLDDPDTGHLRIFTPAAELPFAGHPLVGTAWLLSRHLGRPVTQLSPPAGPVPTWTSDDQVWIRAPLAAAPPWRLNQVADAAAVEAMTEPPHPDHDADQFWAWIDQRAGTVRARVFAGRYGVPEDEACGSASSTAPDHWSKPAPPPTAWPTSVAASCGTTSVPSISHQGPALRCEQARLSLTSSQWVEP